jgi:hypothetical protein
MKGRIGFPSYGKNFAKETANFKKIIKTRENEKFPWYIQTRLSAH